MADNGNTTTEPASGAGHAGAGDARVGSAGVGQAEAGALGGSGAIPDFLAELMRLPGEMTQAMLGQLLPGVPPAIPALIAEPEDAAHWGEVAARMQAMWLEFQSEQVLRLASGNLGTVNPATGRFAAGNRGSTPGGGDPAQWQKQWMERMGHWYRQLPLSAPEAQARIWEEGLALWQGVLGQFGPGPYGMGAAGLTPGNEPVALPRSDPRFAAAQWREQPFYAMLHQTYLMFAEQVMAMADAVDGIEPGRKEQLRFATATLVDALSPDHFPLTNPLVIERAIDTRGDSLVKGMEHLIADMRRGQLTQSDPEAFRVGENIAITPGKVVHETPLFQLIQYAPTTESVLAVPLVIFPPWINRFYILDLNPKKSFVKWAVDQGITVFMVSWKSADASMADLVWDDYIAAQIAAIDAVRERLKVPAVHCIGYCVAGTTLAATLAVLARRGEADKVKSATFLTAQVDFEKAGELKTFVDDQQIAAIETLGPEGFLDGRYMAATFNLLRGRDLIWNYVIDNYLLGQEYKPFDLMHWNSDTTNLPIKWHSAYLRDLYRDNRLVEPDSLQALGTPIDISRIVTPCYIQAGAKDHIAPPESVWRFTRHLPHAEWTFVLAGSGHIAGVVNPPAAAKYQHWTNPARAESLAEFLAGASEHKGSWWPHWAAWLRAQDEATVPARGKRAPGGRGDPIIEEAPGRYVKMR